MKTAFRPDDIRNTDSPVIDAVMTDARSSTVRQALQAMALRAARDTGAEADYLTRRLFEQESSAPSGVGGGVVIAHMRLAGLTDPYTLFARTPRALTVGAVDGRPADLFFLLLSPHADISGHLRRLSRLSRLMRDELFQQKLRAVENTDGCEALFLMTRDKTLAA